MSLVFSPLTFVAKWIYRLLTLLLYSETWLMMLTTTVGNRLSSLFYSIVSLAGKTVLWPFSWGGSHATSVVTSGYNWWRRSQSSHSTGEASNSVIKRLCKYVLLLLLVPLLVLALCKFIHLCTVSSQFMY